MKEYNREIILVRYYNVLFYLFFRVGIDEYKKNIFLRLIESGAQMGMKDIYVWSREQHISVRTQFVYRRDFSIVANLWNLYSYCRFILEVY